MKEDNFRDVSQIVVLRRSWRSLVPSLIPALIAGVVGVWVTQDSSMFRAPISIPLGEQIIRFELPLFLLVFLVLLGRPLMLRSDSYSEIRPHHLVAIRGRLSIRRLSTSIPYEDIRGVEIVEGIWDRMVGCGNLICWSVDAEVPEIKIVGIAHVEKYAKLVKTRIDAARLAHGSDGTFGSQHREHSG